MVIYNVQLFFKRLSDQQIISFIWRIVFNCIGFICLTCRPHVLELSILVNTLLTFPRKCFLLKQKQTKYCEKSRIDHFVSKQCKIFFLMCQFSQLITHEKVNIMNSWMAKTSFFLVNKDVYLPYTHLYFPLHLIHQDMIF